MAKWSIPPVLAFILVLLYLLFFRKDAEQKA